MTTIQISPDETALFKDFDEGTSVQVRVNVPGAEAAAYQKGKTVKVVYKDKEATGKIVSDPLEINTDSEDGYKIFSLIVEKN
jgi:hypothetical protein